MTLRKMNGPNALCRSCNRAPLTPAEKLMMAKVAAQRALLAKIKSETKIWPPKYLRYCEMPPPNPQERERLRLRFRETVQRIKSGEDAPDYHHAASQQSPPR